MCANSDGVIYDNRGSRASVGVLESGIGNFPMRIEIGDFTLFAHTKSLIRRYANTASARIDTS
jgi:hypothetical protein